MFFVKDGVLAINDSNLMTDLPVKAYTISVESSISVNRLNIYYFYCKEAESISIFVIVSLILFTIVIILSILIFLVNKYWKNYGEVCKYHSKSAGKTYENLISGKKVTIQLKKISIFFRR